MDGKALHEAFAGMVQDYDRERVRDRDIKKLFQWYNMLLGAGYTSFTEKPESEEKAEEKSAE